MLRYLSVCSGIESASVAWEPLGWIPLAFSEVDPFPSAVLAHHYPHVPNLGDMTRFEEWPEEIFAEADVIVGGCPCQAFSVAGLRGGLSDERGNLTLVFIRLINHADAIRRNYGKPPVIVVYENVPGLLSSRDGAFGSFLGGLAGEDEALQPPGKKWSDAGCVFGPERSVAWRILDARHFRLAQRRRRVFVVASAGEVGGPEILLVEEGLRGDSAPGREAGQDAATLAGRRTQSSSHWDDPRNPHPTLSQSHNTGGLGGSNQEIFSQRGAGLVPMAFNHQAGGSLFPIAPNVECVNTLQASQGQAVMVPLPSLQTLSGVASTLSTENGGKRSSPRGDGTDNLVVAFALRGREEGAVPEIHGDGQTVGTLRAAGGGSSRDYVAFGGNNTSGPIEVATARVASPSASGRLDFETETFLVEPCNLGVRRITPEEAEALQGFPRSYTRIPWRGKPAEQCPDGPRQKALGNSMATLVMRRIGEWIQEAVNAQREAAD
ncbi:DNA cytosine methyltransferase [Deinococcus sp. S9]|uniref:DNA cytosine methyltransferase n=1 Tax=Deinococcus sp. S9 TaxID=2545754 RepID=UPI0010566537|nr:DNA cytosine methyltransferase [Deinococcus sp. S9]TDE87377.1 DNA cytosine methyltransferase [Deinococcus sp. S9]